MAYTTVLFDLDHTLLDSDTSERLAYESTLVAAGVREPAALFPLYQRINRAMWADVEAGRMHPEDVRVRRFEAFNTEAGIDADPVTMAEQFIDGLGGNGELYPGALSMLSSVREHARLGLLTNGISQVQRTRITRLELEEIFSAIVVSSEVNVAKPAPEIFATAFEMLGDPQPGTALMVGDSLTSDVAGALAYGIDACWYNPSGKSEVSGPIPHHVVSGFDQIVDLVLN